VHVSRLATDEGFIGLDFAGEFFYNGLVSQVNNCFGER